MVAASEELISNVFPVRFQFALFWFNFSGCGQNETKFHATWIDSSTVLHFSLVVLCVIIFWRCEFSIGQMPNAGGILFDSMIGEAVVLNNVFCFLPFGSHRFKCLHVFPRMFKTAELVKSGLARWVWTLGLAATQRSRKPSWRRPLWRIEGVSAWIWITRPVCSQGKNSSPQVFFRCSSAGIYFFKFRVCKRDEI